MFSLNQQFNTLNTENGKVKFVECIGCTDDELLSIRKKEIEIEELYKKLGTDVTDYNRTSVLG